MLTLRKASSTLGKKDCRITCEFSRPRYFAGDFLDCQISLKSTGEELKVEFCAAQLYGEVLYVSELVPRSDMVEEVSIVKNKQFNRNFFVFDSPVELVMENEVLAKRKIDHFFSAMIPEDLIPSYKGEAMKVAYYLVIELKLKRNTESKVRKFPVEVCQRPSVTDTVLQIKSIDEFDYKVQVSRVNKLDFTSKQVTTNLNIIDSDFLNFADSEYKIQYMTNKFVSSPINKKTIETESHEDESKEQIGLTSYNIGTCGSIITKVFMHKTSFTLDETILLHFEMNSDAFEFKTIAIFAGFEQRETMSQDYQPSLINAFNALAKQPSQLSIKSHLDEDAKILSSKVISSHFEIVKDFSTYCMKFKVPESAAHNFTSPLLNVENNLVLEIKFAKKESKNNINEDDMNSIQFNIPITITPSNTPKLDENRSDDHIINQNKFFLQPSKIKRKLWI